MGDGLTAGELVLVTVNGQTASVTTRRRVRTQGPRFIVQKLPDDKHPKSVNLLSPETSWSGWVPLREIRVHRVFHTAENG